MDKLVSYRNYSSVQDENVPITPEVDSAIAQGYTNNYILLANTHRSLDVPTDARFALFNSSADIWVKIDGTAIIPTSDILDGTGSELNPVLRYIGSSSKIGVISSSQTILTVMFYT
jgi:hypothetical protein